MDHLKINHFKCFEDVDILLNRLTVMAGANGNGKSTSIQAILYLRRTIEHCGEWVNGRYQLNKINGLNVPLNGVYCLALGNSTIVLNRNNNENTITIGLQNDLEKLFVEYEADNLDSKIWLSPTKVEHSENPNLSILQQEFYYLNAERLGPRINQSLQFWDYPNAGWQGENTAQLVGLEGGYFKIENDRRFKNTETNFLQDQLNNWLGFIMEGVKVRVETSNKTLTAQILIENQYTLSEPTLATNLGFGISYVLPIIATGLIAKKGSYMIVENPEAHLHPSAQSKIGRFLAMVANAGINVIVETHSDHIINGIQIAVALKEIENNFVTINFFSQENDKSQPNVNPISIKEKGELTKWPKGFFDQTQIDYSNLIGLRKDV
jgi:predicted ATPase